MIWVAIQESGHDLAEVCAIRVLVVFVQNHSSIQSYDT